MDFAPFPFLSDELNQHKLAQKNTDTRSWPTCFCWSLFSLYIYILVLPKIPSSWLTAHPIPSPHPPSLNTERSPPVFHRPLWISKLSRLTELNVSLPGHSLNRSGLRATYIALLKPLQTRPAPCNCHLNAKAPWITRLRSFCADFFFNCLSSWSMVTVCRARVDVWAACVITFAHINQKNRCIWYSTRQKSHIWIPQMHFDLFSSSRITSLFKHRRTSLSSKVL